MTLFEAVAKLTLDTTEFNNNLDKAKGETDQSGNKISKALGTVAKAGAAGLAATTTAVVAFGKSSVDAGMNFDSSMSQVAATMGKTTKEMESEVGSVDLAWGTFSGNLREYAQEMGARTSFSATAAADALNYMALAGYDTQTSMEMLPNVLNLAAAGSMDLATASDMVTDASSALGLSMDETQELVDKMAQASSKSNTSVAQLGEAILTVGGTAKTLKGGTTELSTALGILADNGVKGAEGGTALRNIILSLGAPTDKAKDALIKFGGAEKLVYDEAGNMRSLNDIFGDLNVILGDMKDSERTELLNTMFNKVDLKSVNALLANTGTNMDGVGEALAQCGIEWGKYNDNIIQSKDSAEALQEWSTEMLWTNLDTAEGMAEMQEHLRYEYGMTAEDAKTAVEAVSASLSNQETRWDELTGYIDEAHDSAQKMADTQLDNLSGDITLFQSALEGAQIAISDKLTPTLRDFVKTGSDGISKVTTAFREEGLSGAMKAFGEWLSDAIGMIVEKIPSIISAGSQMLIALVKGLVENLPKMAEAAVEVVASLASGLGSAYPTLIPTMVEAVLTMVEALINNVDKLVDGAVELMIGLATGLIDALPILIDKVPDIILALVHALVENIPKIGEAGARLLTAIVSNLPTIIADIVKQIPKILQAIVEAILGGTVSIASAGLQLIGGLVTGIRDGIKNAVDAVKELGSNIIKAIKGFFGIHSPSTVFRDIGENLIGGLINGIKGTWKKVTDFFTGAISKIPDFFKNLPGNLKKIGTNAIEGITNGAKTAWGGLKNTVSSVASGLKDAFTDVPGKLKDYGSKILDNLKTTSEGIKKAFSGVPDSMKTIGTNIVNFLSSGIGSGMSKLGEALNSVGKGISDWMSNLNSAKDTLLTVGSNLMAGLANGITQAARNALEAAKSAASAVVNGVKTVFGVSSPSKVFHGIGGYLMEGMAEGIEDNTDIVGHAVDALSKVTGIEIKAPQMQSVQTGSVPYGAQGIPAGAEYQVQRYGAQSGRDMTVILELDKMQFARAVYKLNDEETQRVGLKLAGGYA